MMSNVPSRFIRSRPSLAPIRAENAEEPRCNRESEAALASPKTKVSEEGQRTVAQNTVRVREPQANAFGTLDCTCADAVGAFCRVLVNVTFVKHEHARPAAKRAHLLSASAALVAYLVFAPLLLCSHAVLGAFGLQRHCHGGRGEQQKAPSLDARAFLRLG